MKSLGRVDGEREREKQKRKRKEKERQEERGKTVTSEKSESQALLVLILLMMKFDDCQSHGTLFSPSFSIPLYFSLFLSSLSLSVALINTFAHGLKHITEYVRIVKERGRERVRESQIKEGENGGEKN